MKKIVITLTAAFLAFSCAVNEEGPAKQAKYTIYGTINEEDTRVKIVENGTKFSHHWQSTDKISVFDGASTSSFEYSVYEGIGTNTASFTGDNQVTTNPFYAVYPHNIAKAVTETDGNTVFTVSFPSEQAYVQNSYDPTANVYVAKGTKSIDANGIDEDVLSFYNTTAYLRLSLYGGDSDNAATVSKIELSTIGGEPIAGIGTVTLNGDEAVVTLADVTEDSGTFSTVTLAPTEAVTISTDADKATNFFFSVPAVNYGESFQGYQIKIYSGSGDTQTYQWRNVSRALSANVVRKMAALKYNPTASGSIAILTSGYLFSRNIKRLANNDQTIGYVNNVADNPTRYVSLPDSKITKIVFVTNKNMTGINGTSVASSGSTPSPYPILATFKDGTLTVQTEAEKIRLSDGGYLFNNLTALTEIEGMENVICNQTGYLNCRYYGCSSLTSLDLTDCGPGNYATIRYDYMFYGCTSLESLVLPDNGGYLRRADKIDNMFFNCSSLTSLSLSNIGTDNTNLLSTSNMFSGCSSLESITFGSSFTCDAVTDMSGMFEGCSNLGNLNLQYFNTSSVTNASKMFDGAFRRTNCTLRFKDSDGFTNCTDFSYMFRNATHLGHIYNSDKIKPSGGDDIITNCTGMFYGTYRLGYIYSNYAYLDLSGFSPAGYVDCTDMFGGVLSGDKFTPNMIKDIRFSQNGFKISSAKRMFRYCTNLEKIANIDKLQIASDADLSYMFYYCNKIDALNISLFDIRNISDENKLAYLFFGMAALRELTLGNNFICNYAPVGFFMGSTLSSTYQTGNNSSDGFLNIRCTEETGKWLIKTNLRLAHPTHSTYTTKVDTKFHIWNSETESYEYKTVYSKLGSIDDYAASTTYIYWPSTVTSDPDLDWTGNTSGESQSSVPTTF